MSENNSPRSIAGHRFVDDIHGLTCLDCARRFVDIAGVRESDIGSDGWASQGALNRAEYNQIRALVEHIAKCTRDVASGAGIGGTLPGDFEEMEGFR